MEISRPYVLSIAGFDPSAGAGVLADVKTFEQHQTMGFGVNTSITYQTEDQFLGTQWLDLEVIESQLMPLLLRYPIASIKVGLINLKQLEFILPLIPVEIPMVWDPVLSATAGDHFENQFTSHHVASMLDRFSLITPNLEEYKALGLASIPSINVLLKGGHATAHKNDRLLLVSGGEHVIEGEVFPKPYQKHGTGCVLSSAIASNIALGYSVLDACTLAKRYVEKLLLSNDSLLGYHS